MELPRLFCTLTLLYLRYVRTQMSRGTKTLWILLKSIKIKIKRQQQKKKDKSQPNLL